MRKLLIVIASAAALASCGTAHHRMFGKTSLDPKKVEVDVVQGTTQAYIVVSQDPLVFVGDQGEVDIRWKLQNPNYDFDNTGISITARPITGTKNPINGCQGNGSDESSCKNNTNDKATVKYT